MDGNWTQCKTKEAGKWTSIQMVYRSGTELSSNNKLRSQRSLVSMMRQKLANQCMVNSFIALESKDDADGFNFWLAKTDTIAFKWDGKNETREGVKLKKGGLYITVTIYDRFPSSSPTTFKAVGDPWIIDAESVIANRVQVHSTVPRTRRTRSVNSSGAQVAGIMMMDMEEVNRLDALSIVRLG